MWFEIVGELSGVETIAVGSAIRERHRLNDAYGEARWRKLKGSASVRLESGEVLSAELHWYEAHGLGRFEFKIKRFQE